MSLKHRLLIVDEDDLLCQMLQAQFAMDDAFEVDVAEQGSTALTRVDETAIDLVLLNHRLADMSGESLCEALRAKGYQGPIIAMMSHGQDTEKIAANDHVLKPFRFAVLLARVRALLRQFEHADDQMIMIGPYQFKPGQKLLKLDETTPIRLTEKETAILKYLYRANGQSVGRDELLTEVWGYHVEVSTHTLETHIYRLRQKLEKHGAASDILLTDAGGYRLALSSGVT
jgi:DNA-binding response OmpR family regulator